MKPSFFSLNLISLSLFILTLDIYVINCNNIYININEKEKGKQIRRVEVNNILDSEATKNINA
jgi:hypothetical protein